MRLLTLLFLLPFALSQSYGKQITPARPSITPEPSEVSTAPIIREPLQLLYFTASWCGPCQMMKSQTWPNPNVKRALENYKFQTIDVDESPKLAEQWSVRAMPTFLIADPEGKSELTRMTGFMDAKRMQVWLSDVYELAYTTLEEQRAAKIAFTQQWTQLDPLFEETIDAETLHQSNQALFTLLALRDDLEPDSAQDLERVLVSLAETYPERVVDGFLHKDLQVRARIARALRSDGLSLNPWEPLEARQLAVESYLAPQPISDE